MSNKRLYIKTFGCQMNARDSEYAAGILLEKGFALATSPEKADVILFNSCSVRKHAEDRLFSNIAELKDLKKKKAGLVIGLMGCTAQNYGHKVFEKAPLVDFVCGPGNEADLPRIIDDVSKNGCAVIATDKVDAKKPETFPEYREGDFKAYVSIGEGCNNFCSYCIVPYVRGRERSRDARNVIREVKGLASRGFKEITLLGQNVNSYKGSGKGSDFVGLLEKINKIDGIKRIRFMTSHPKDASIDLFKAMRDLENVCEHLHLPLQSGSDRILKLMNRGYTSGKYLGLAESYKKILPKGALTADVIVGFPSEEDEDLKKTRDLMEKIGFDSVYIFKYSPRPPAESARLKDDVDKETKERRLKDLLGLQSEISRKNNLSMLDKEVEVLIDGKNKKDTAFLTGRTRTNKITVFKGDSALVGSFVNVKVDSVTPYSLKGRLLKILTVLIFIWNFCLPDADAKEATLAQAEKFFLEARYEKAEEEADRLIDLRIGERAKLYYLEGLCDLKLKKFDGARDTFGSIISRCPDSENVFDAHIGIGDSYFLEGRLDNAAAVYKDILKKFPGERNISVVQDRLKDCRGLEPALSGGKDERNPYSVQVGCFKSKRNAERMSVKLQREGYESFVGLQDIKGLYRVKVGKLRSEAAARGLALKLNKGGYRTKICNDG